MGQRYMYGTQSSLTTVLLNDVHPHTIYINDCNLHLDVKTCDDENDEIGEQYDGNICELNEAEDSVKTEGVKENKEPQKPKNNRWAKKRALQNKKPKFKIITEYSKDYFRKIELDNKELPLFMQSERDSEYFKSKRYKCEKCVLVFSSEKFLQKHDNKYHSKSTPYTCDICSSSLSNKRLLSRHVKSHYNKYSCTICDFTCFDKSQTKWHFQKSHRRIFQCVKCELKFGCRKEFFRHYKQWHEKFICDYCGISFKMRYCIKDHIRKQHGEFVCVTCNKRWARYNGLWLHNKTTHAPRQSAYCVECDTHYADVYRYRWHLANSAKHTKHKKHRIPCPGCDKIFSKNIYMKDHYNLVHLKHYKYRCEQCDKNFIRNADLVKHTRRVHEGILPPKNKICYMCGRGFSTNKILTNHLRTHTGEKPFACTICNARFAQSTALSAHARAIHHTVQKHV
ncbi:GDNF-inducible zinc finger protein 1-like isoform X1 [Helicoverpa zea]|uniref:GDNF-inducible zinc finger protein 1-like isoform X1 n=2 Tax=Helicoverpa zea TaxID=7113 RepID=UPI001F5828AE|nr:GDNF-inducible zinc finger protein 1-like isoform X1 [Helicoverpa zea]XP_047040030.1 GDNF-inducible zinc finger protein 1-like isoform X1 [Helicoverpa zea]XP_047040031.1 GDNF-inducible zinc finger protein 1-like isoform X1 [Helicoverpa zea]